LLDPAIQLNVETHSERRALRVPLGAHEIAILRRIS
jgi:hypothetical protein